MGSGTTGVACKNLKRNFIGIEKDEKWFNTAKQRIEGTYVSPVVADKPKDDSFEKYDWGI